jgi:hypothetical protein
MKSTGNDPAAVLQTVGAMFRWALSRDIVETDPHCGTEGLNHPMID